MAPRVTSERGEAEVSSFWGGMFGTQHPGEDPDAEEWCLDASLDSSVAIDGHGKREDLRAASSQTGNSAPGPDGPLFAFCLRGGAVLGCKLYSPRAICRSSRMGKLRRSATTFAARRAGIGQ